MGPAGLCALPQKERGLGRVQDKIKICQYAESVYKKCDCCGRPKDNVYKVLIMSVDLQNRVAGELSLCRKCGNNLAKIVGADVPPEEEVVKEFKFG